MMTEEDRRARFEQYRKENIKRVPLDMKRDQYERIKAHAVLEGIPVNRYIKEAIEARMDKEDKQRGVSSGTMMRINEYGKVEYYRQFSAKQEDT